MRLVSEREVNICLGMDGPFKCFKLSQGKLFAGSLYANTFALL